MMYSICYVAGPEDHPNLGLVLAAMPEDWVWGPAETGSIEQVPQLACALVDLTSQQCVNISRHKLAYSAKLGPYTSAPELWIDIFPPTPPPSGVED